MEFLFGKQPTQKERVKMWTSELKREMRAIDRDMTKIEREEAKMKMELRKVAKQGDKKACAIMAKSLVKSRHTREKMLTTRTQINSVCLTLKQNYASQEVVKVMARSGVIMQNMNRLISVPQISEVCRKMQKEMMTAGIIEETIQEAFDDLDEPETEEQVEAEVNQVLYEITKGQLGALPEATTDLKGKQQQEVDVDEEQELAAMKARLESL